MNPTPAAGTEPPPATSRSGAPPPESSEGPRFPWAAELDELFATSRCFALQGAEYPGKPGETSEESARNAAFWVFFHMQGIVENFVAALRRGEDVRMEAGVYVRNQERVDFNIRIVEREADPTPEGLA
jgi:hypothetical protein